MSFWANDGFKGKDGVWGGDLVDNDTPFAGRDKAQHLLVALLLGAAWQRWFPTPFFTYLVLFLVLGIFWELVEYIRLKRGKVFAADKPSWRDILTNLAGAILAYFVF